MVIQGSTWYKCKVNTAHQMELFVMWDLQETEGWNVAGGR